MCECIKGMLSNELIKETEFLERYNKHIKYLTFYYNNNEKAKLYNVSEPNEFYEFTYCPFCGKKF